MHSAADVDARTSRYVARAEQQRRSADAQLERRARAAQLDLELREQRRAVTRREHEARIADRQERAERGRTRRAQRRARLRVAALAWGDRALFVLPILFPMAVAWVGQIRFAMAVMSWPLPAAIVFAAGFELSTAYVARLDWLSRAAGDSALLFRAATWGFAAGAGLMNYWHAAGPGFAPTGEAVSYGSMSLTGVVLWELMSAYRHRTALRARGKLPATRPRFGLARWIWFSTLTRLAWLLALRDGYTTTDSAWRAALNAVDRYGTAKKARKAVRAGRPLPPPALPAPAERDDTGATDPRVDADPIAGERDTGNHQTPPGTEPRSAHRDTPARTSDRNGSAQDLDRDRLGQNPDRDPRAQCPGRDDGLVRGPERDRPAPRPDRTPVVQDPDRDDPRQEPEQNRLVPGRDRDDPGRSRDRDHPARDGQPDSHRRADRDVAPPDRDESPSSTPPPGQAEGQTSHGDGSQLATDRDARQRTDEPAVSARMLAYARTRLAEGRPVTGADLDRRFGTRDYGRRVLRRLTAQGGSANPLPVTPATATATPPPTRNRHGRTSKRRHRRTAGHSGGGQA